MSSAVQAALASWAFPPWISVSLLLTALIYWRGWRKLQFTRPASFPVWRLACFWTGLLTLWLAVASPLDSLGGMLLFLHMTQHLVLMSVAPPLILLGAPVVPLLRGLPRSFVREALGPFFSMGVLHKLGSFLTRPAVGWLAMNLTYIGWHLTPAYELALHSPAWHEVEHAFFFFSCILFWWPIILPWPSVARGSRWLILPYLVTADLVNTGLSAFFCFAGRTLYPTYSEVPRLFGLTALQDQIAAGALMWVIGSTIFLVPAGWITLQLLSPKLTSRQEAAVPRRVPRPVDSRPFDLLRVPLIGWLLRARYGRMGLQAITLAIAIVAILHGLFGHPMGSMNLAGIVPWTYARALGVIALLAAGNLFCMACPFTLPRELGHRMGLATRTWPVWLRNKWLSAFLLVFLFWMFEAFTFWDQPARTAWIVIAYFVAAFVTDTFFRGASFCKYVCPIGQFNFVSSLLSPLEVKSASPSVCSSCKTHDCIAGNERQRGCELQLFIPQKTGNMDCTLCMDCVKACPHDNIVIAAGPPARDLLIDPVRSSIGRLSSRVDIATVALVVVSAAFATSAVMVEPVSAWLQHIGGLMPGYSALATSFVASFLLPATLLLITVAAAYAVWKFSQSPQPARVLFCRLSLALLPLGLGMWAAHLLFHLLSGWSTLVPGVQQAAIDLGIFALGRPQWGAAMSSPLTANGMLLLQLLILDGGLLLSLYVGWRVVRGMIGGIVRPACSMLPWAAVVASLYAVGIWILLQPMQMRNMVHG
ncbi:MAG TPA: cytochrome c oxidase assembly protein [Acidisarcina sp.]|nr:cytochrome c oxidase assembly protein [Acidisarcina sp.]